jgi:hypothetical protein
MEDFGIIISPLIIYKLTEIIIDDNYENYILYGIIYSLLLFLATFVQSFGRNLYFKNGYRTMNKVNF